MNTIQSYLQKIEVGEGQIITRIIPLLMALILVGGLYNFGPITVGNWFVGGVYRGLSDSQSMDNAQLARQLARGQGFTTEFLRPYAVTQLRDYTIKQGAKLGVRTDLFPPDQFPAGTPRCLPDTYNAPGYPLLLAAWFKVVRPNFNQPIESMSNMHAYIADRLIPPLNLIFMFLTATLVFILALQLFDGRVAWISLLSFLLTDLVWQYTLTALSTSVLTFLVTAVLFCAVEIFSVGEACAEDQERTFGAAWIWAAVLTLFLSFACLTHPQLLILLAPLLLLLVLMPRANYFLFPIIALITICSIVPWFMHWYEISGNPLGSNTPLLLYGGAGYEGGQIFRSSEISSYDALFKDVIQKEFQGFQWHFEHAWGLLGYNPLILLFVASFMHQFRQLRVRALQWLLAGFAIALIAANNFCVANPESLDSWNMLVLLLPCMLIIGSAFFFVLLTRLDIQINLLNSLIVTTLLLLTAVPMFSTLTSSSGQVFSFPPYIPPTIKAVGQFAKQDEWVTSDMPWATAWYADRPSLWLPDSMTKFENYNDTLVTTGVLIMTPVTWSKPASNLLIGEDKDWITLCTGINVPATFPLHAGLKTPPGGPEYSIWSDHERWKQH